ncbi:MAG: hypothetical protein OEY81_02790 [Candidatus Bathyarchaeota archaeon]|nr:hypothetical protein [Candidatus Bathyarchaeota archaeon]
MRRLIVGFLTGFGAALSIILFTGWNFLLAVLDSGYVTVAEADVIEAAQLATTVGAMLGILLIAAGVGVELLARTAWAKTGKTKENQRTPLD